MKHGMCATDEVFLSALTRHERQVFENLRQTFHEHYHPEREQERLLVDRIVIEQFRLLRLYRIEHQAYRRDANTEQLRHSMVPYIDRFSRYEAHTNRILRVLHNRLLHLYYEQEAHLFKPMPVKE